MKIGYPCINLSVNSGAKTFRLATYSEAKLKEVVENNIFYLNEILQFNIANGLLFLRISSGMIPFASHPVCKVDWADFYKDELKKIGNIIKKNKIRISMHPDQFVLINTPKDQVLENSISELIYHNKLLDSFGLDCTHKIQIHVGGVYDDKQLSIQRFIERYKKLPLKVKKRLVVENDDRLYSLADCLFINKKTQIPVLLDVFHHKCYNQGENMALALKKAAATWSKSDGVPILDYSSQKPHARKGNHIESINARDFADFIKNIGRKDFDIMLEIKDKEKSALKAREILKKLKKL
ncbi:MAG: UV DNA damage repair endonuclease UvsE [Candidatus Buchananbacteria bacterium]